jgi:gliding motility-associated lipoprotein GldH
MKGWCVVSIALLLASCSDPSVLLKKNIDLENRAWNVSDTLRFEFQIRDIAPSYSIDYLIRNSLEYPYARIFVAYQLHDSTGVLVSEKLVSNYLFHEKTGEPFGSSGLGDVYDHRFPLLEDFRFSRNGRFHLRLVQQMRVDTLPGIMAVGARVAIKKK